MDKYTPITTRDELARAIELGLRLQCDFKGNPSARDYQRHEQGPDNGWTAAWQDSARRDSADENAFASSSLNWRAVGVHDLSAPAKPAPLTNADLNPGDIVHGYGKDWRVQGIDDNAPDSGLLLVDTAEPEDADDFVDTAFGVTRGIGRRPSDGAFDRWRWGGAGEVELVSRGEPKPEFTAEGPLAVGDLVRVARDWTGFGVHGPVDRARFLGVVGRIAKDDREIDGTLGLSAPDGGPLNMDGARGLLWVHPAQLSRVEEQDADTPEGYAAALEALSQGIES